MLTRRIGIIRREDQSLSPAARRLLEVLEEVLERSRHRVIVGE
jgi:hypothetical protein